MTGHKVSIKISRKTLFLCFLLFPVLKPAPDGLSVLFGPVLAGFLYRGLRLYNYITITITIYLFITKGIRRRAGAGTFLIILLSMVLVISSMKMGNVSYKYLYEVVGNILMIFFLGNLYSREKIYYYIEAAYYYLTFLMIMNSASIYLFYPGGMYSAGTNTDYYLFGLDNVGFMYTLAGFFLGQLYHMLKERKPVIRFYLVYLIIGSAYLYVRAGTGTIIVLACAITSVLYHKNLLRRIDMRIAGSICAVVYIAIVVFQSVGVFGWVLALIDKSTTFTGRTYIWEAMFRALPEHLWTGFGISTEVTGKYLMKYGMGRNWLKGIGHLHNVVLEILFRGGLSGLILFLLFWILLLKRMQKYADHQIANLLCIQMILQWLTCMFEFRMYIYTFWFVPMCMYEIESLVMRFEDG